MFASLKMALTGVGVLLMVLLARYRFMRLVRVEVILYCILLVYVALIGHEIGMLQQVADRLHSVDLAACVTFHIVSHWAKLRAYRSIPFLLITLM